MTEAQSSKPDFRIDHTMLRVDDLDKTLHFYVDILGMQVLRQNEYPEGLSLIHI